MVEMCGNVSVSLAKQEPVGKEVRVCIGQSERVEAVDLLDFHL